VWKEGVKAMPGRRGNSEGSIVKRGDGRWMARFTLDNGERKTPYAKTRQEAARALAEAIRDRDKGLPIVGDGKPLSSISRGGLRPFNQLSGQLPSGSIASSCSCTSYRHLAVWRLPSSAPSSCRCCMQRSSKRARVARRSIYSTRSLIARSTMRCGWG